MQLQQTDFKQESQTAQNSTKALIPHNASLYYKDKNYFKNS